MSQLRPTRGRQKGSATATPDVSAKSLTPAPYDPAQLPSRCTRRSASRLSTPVNNKEKDRIPIKEEPEARILRTRPSLHADKSESLSIANHMVPVGPDGQPLPTCVTCHNVLPMISVDNQIVWGLNIDTTPRRGKKRKEPQECPRYVDLLIHLNRLSHVTAFCLYARCMRHFAIYSQPWPARLASQVVAPTPRDDGESSSRRLVQKNVSTVEAKQAVGEERPAKKRKIEQGPVVEMSDKAKELLMAPKRKRGRPRKHPMAEEVPKRKRGRPRKSSPIRPIHAPPHSRSYASTPVKIIRPRISSPVSMKSRSEPASPSSSRSNLKPKSLAVKLQPRDSNGRFGKKATTNGRFVRKRIHIGILRSSSPRARVLQRAKVERWLGDKHEQLDTNNETEDLHVLASGKRGRATIPDDSPRPSKKLRSSPPSGDGDEDAVPHNPSGSSALKFKGLNAGLLCRPNPTNFARRAWAPPPPEDYSPDDEDAEGSLPTIESESSGPVTPQDHTPLPIPSPDQLPFQGKASLDSKLEEPAPRLPTPRHSTQNISTILTFRPSPINFARRRWSSTTKSPLESGTGTRRSQRLRPRSSLPDENNLSLTTSQSEISSALSTRPTLAGRSVSPQKSTIVHVAAQAMSEAATEAVRMVSWLFHIHKIEHPSQVGDLPDYILKARTVLPGEQSFESTNSDDDRAVEGLLAETPESHEGPANEDPLSHLRVTYTTELPAVVPWKNAQATPMSYYLKKSASFCGDELASPTHLVHAGWDSASDILSD